MKSAGCKVAHNISDEKLIEKINELSDADEAKLKSALSGILVVDPVELYFASAADTVGQTVTATVTGVLSAVSDSAWATVTVSGNVATVKVAANTGASAARKANIRLSGDGRTVVVVVTQESY
jgi:hypothetical protein